jgi:hypothetical protein
MAALEAQNDSHDLAHRQQRQRALKLGGHWIERDAAFISRLESSERHTDEGAPGTDAKRAGMTRAFERHAFRTPLHAPNVRAQLDVALVGRDSVLEAREHSVVAIDGAVLSKIGRHFLGISSDDLSANVCGRCCMVPLHEHMNQAVVAFVP